jgi:UDPglucose 6-dehydrogenase
MTTPTVGIIGMGTVGKAVYNAFSPVIPNIKCYDIEHPCDSLSDIHKCEFVFVCVPTDCAVEAIASLCNGKERSDQVVIVKSTVPPRTCMELARAYECDLVHNPEFLTERTANLDFINAPRIVLGGTGIGHGVERAEELYRMRFRSTPIIKAHSNTTEFAKYMINLYFMTKVTFMNEMRDAATGAGASWDKTLEIFTTDGRIVPSHIDVPGHDGSRGFGGKCFPDNIESYLGWANSADVKCDMIEKVKELNDFYRD